MTPAPPAIPFDGLPQAIVHHTPGTPTMLRLPITGVTLQDRLGFSPSNVIVPNRDVDDVVHDAFLKAFERLNDLTDPSAFRGWLGSIIVRDVRSHMRRAKLMRTLGLIRSGDVIDLDALASADASPSVRAQIAQVYALLRTQPVDERIAWILRAVEGHDLESVARMTSCSLATAKRRIARVQKFLDEHFVDSYTEQGEP